MKLITCQQGTAEWFAARCGVITASKFKDATDRYVKATAGKQPGDWKPCAEHYAFAIAVERMSGEVLEDQYQTYAMRRGQELEAAARLLYIERTGAEVTETGVVVTDCGNYGYSADGLVGTDGAIEIKSPLSPRSILPVLAGDLSEYIDQMQGGLMINEREWCDFVLYTPQLARAGKDLLIRRVYRNDAYIKTLRADLDQFNDLVWDTIAKLSA